MTRRDAIAEMLRKGIHPSAAVEVAERILALPIEHGWVDAADLRERLVTAEKRLRELVVSDYPTNWGEWRLAGKADGVRLALSYLDEMIRSAG